jgi:hypothetical protein
MIWKMLQLVILIGDPYSSQVYIMYGNRRTGFENMTLVGSIIFGVTKYDYTGFVISAAGEFNEDGISDMVVGMPYYR